ncbi:MAG: hypothetical protein U5N85_06220 [Arcicella sp.]|nr:hypothetical protein [Arcicella sp.]
MFLRGKTIANLCSFIVGYNVALEIRNLKEENQIDWSEFNFWVAKRLKRTETADWSMLIWVESFGNESVAISRFFDFYDAYFEETLG